MKILEEIKQSKLKEVQIRKELYPIKLLEQSIYFSAPNVSMKKCLLDTFSSGIIAEFKRKSPSKGDINKQANVQDVTLGYTQAGAAALSVLTDEFFFGARNDDLSIARKCNACPILRKDFILDEYQIIESKSMGADVILLIAKLLSPVEIVYLSKVAKSLGMEVLVEFHSEEEILENNFEHIDLAGINNRNLNSFEVDFENSIRLASLIPNTSIKIAESGIESAKSIKLLRENGFKGFLIGEYFMRNDNPSQTCKELIKALEYEN